MSPRYTTDRAPRAHKPLGKTPLESARGLASMYARRISNGHVMPVTDTELRFHADNMLNAIQRLKDGDAMVQVGWAWKDTGRLHSDDYHRRHDHDPDRCTPVYKEPEANR